MTDQEPHSTVEKQEPDNTLVEAALRLMEIFPTTDSPQAMYEKLNQLELDSKVKMMDTLTTSEDLQVARAAIHEVHVVEAMREVYRDVLDGKVIPLPKSPQASPQTQ